ncbi:AIPR family protein [Agromyces cerinus]|uniref:AIPR protein n=1 Tax=Agromyces cerinus subsp. cerinus TaxID=232089 RepID=A0A1N6F204_9MICO|nr:AIPR family protein [Agromyces cerinus]SIN89271.1 AIPR protein [Agromyces cerinus subsp. cerinus]
MIRSATDFHQDLLNSIRTAAAVERTFTGEAFVDEAGRRLTEAEEVDSLIQGHFEGTGLRNRRIGFDGFDFGDEDGHVVLAVSRFTNNDELQTLTESDAKRLFTQTLGFVEAVLKGKLTETLEETSIGYQVAAQLMEQRHRTFKIRIYLITNAKLSTRVKSFPSEELEGMTIEFHPWDINRFQKVEESRLGREEIDIDLREWAADGIPCLKAAITSASVETYLAALPGDVLAGVYRKYGARVLESNVRSFLSVRGNVNKGIRGTILQQPEMFLSFNNGITATATEVKTEIRRGETRLIGIRDLQIVNGGQTTASIFYASREDNEVDLAEVFVQTKLIVVSEEQEADIVPKISRFANTQNRISDADFFSNHKFHQRMEEKSRRILAPPQPGSHFQTKWFYERTRGQYLTEKSRLSPSMSRQFEVEYPRSQLITKTDAARYLVSWSQLPHVVSSGAQKNFIQFAREIDAEWTRNDEQFGDEYFRSLVAKGILFNGVRGRVLRTDWYRSSPGYLANIVAYTIAKLTQIAQTEYGDSSFDLDAIWAAQRVTNELWAAIEPIALAVRLVLTAEDRPVTNVTEWAKREKAWEQTKLLNVKEAKLADFVIAASASDGGHRAAKKEQRLLNGIEAQIVVNDRGSRYWSELRDFARRLRAVSPKELGILSVAVGETGRIVTEAQAMVLVALEARMTDAGFKPR